MFVDYAVSDDCENIYSHGEICVNCGCCSRNPDYKDRLLRLLKYYNERIEEELNFDNWCEGWEEIQKKNIQSNIHYYKRKIRKVKKILRTYRR